MSKQLIKVHNNIVEYNSFNELYTPDENTKLKRAFAYGHAITSLNDVGSGSDECLSRMKFIIREIQEICLEETGYHIDTYDTKMFGSEYSGWKINPYATHKK